MVTPYDYSQTKDIASRSTALLTYCDLFLVTINHDRLYSGLDYRDLVFCYDIMHDKRIRISKILTNEIEW